MLNRYSLIIGGASGTGINTVGIVLTRALKRSGLQVVAYREYPSLIKGGFASYKIDFADEEINAISEAANIYVAIDKTSYDNFLTKLSEQNILIFDKNVIRATDEEISTLKQKAVEVFDLPLTNTAKEIGGNTIMKNTVLMGVLWKVIGLDENLLISAIEDVFNKSKEIEDANEKCALEGIKLVESKNVISKFNVNPKIVDRISISGNESIALGAVAGGVRTYIAYPMTPSTTVLTTVSRHAEEMGIVVKQAEDEITSVNMTIGANHAGTRAMCGTSGGGFDLMTESMSLAGMTETPLVICLAQRPGPATGAPTWTSQGDLRIAVNAGHGEFPRIILAPGDPQDCFELTYEAFNLSEKFQTVVVILTDKYLGETLFTVDPFDSSKVIVDRGELLKGNPDKLLNRYKISDTGISARWLPGEAGNTFVANSDEHDEYGHSIEDADQVKAMIDKRIRKEKYILSALPEPEIFGDEDADISIIGWGSTKHNILDAMRELKKQNKKVNFIFFKYVYPLKTDALMAFAKKSKNLVLIENNETGQLGELIQQETTLRLDKRILKYDGRPFFVEEIINEINKI